MAIVIELATLHRFTSAPVRGALQVAAIDPVSTVRTLLARSIHFHVGTEVMMASMPRGSTRESGQGWSPAMAKLVIWASG